MKKLTLEEFNKLPNSKIFAKGEIENSSKGIFMTRDGGNLRWVAKKGAIEDWAVYVYWNNVSFGYVESNGDKVQGTTNIRNVVPCTDEVLKLYKY